MASPSVVGVVGALLLPPAVLDRWGDNPLKVLRDDSADEQDGDVVLDGLEFGVVNAGLLDEELGPFVENGSHRPEPQVRLPGKPLGLLVDLVDDAVLRGLDALLEARLALVRQDRPCTNKVSKDEGRFLSEWPEEKKKGNRRKNTWHSHNGAVPLIICNHNKPSDSLIDSHSVIVIGLGVGRDFTPITFVAHRPARLTPHDFEDLKGIWVTEWSGDKKMGFIAYLSRLELSRVCDTESCLV